MLFNNESGHECIFHHCERRHKLFTFFDVADAAREAAQDRIAGNSIKNDALEEITRSLPRSVSASKPATKHNSKSKSKVTMSGKWNQRGSHSAIECANGLIISTIFSS